MTRRQPLTAIGKGPAAGSEDEARVATSRSSRSWPVLVVFGLAGAGLAAAYLSHRPVDARSGATTPSSPLLSDVVEETLDDLRAGAIRARR